MNVFIILSILIIILGVLLLVTTPSILFEFNWKEKTGKEKILMFIFYSVLVYIINIIYWIIKWNINGFDIKFGSNYSLISKIPDYEANIEVSSKF